MHLECWHGPLFLPRCLRRLEDNHATCCSLLNSVTHSFSSVRVWLAFLSFPWVFVPPGSLCLLHEFTMSFFSRGDIYVWANTLCFCFSTLWIHSCCELVLVEDTYRLKSMCPKSGNIVFLLLKKIHLRYWIFAKLHTLSENALNKEWGSTFSIDSILAWVLYG